MKEHNMNSKHPLHFDPIAEAAKVDPSVYKKYDMPYHGQTFVQLHQGGTHVVIGTCVGLDMHIDRDGTMTGWKANIDSGFRQPFGINSGSSWRDASEWHPAPEKADVLSTPGILPRFAKAKVG
jgi:hypothetical protein